MSYVSLICVPMNEDRPDHSQRLNEIIAEYLEAVEANSAPDREKLLAAHPDLADELQSFFTEHDRMRAAAGSQEEATLATSTIRRRGHAAATRLRRKTADARHQPEATATPPRSARVFATSATTNCSKRSPAVAWAWSTRPSRSASTASWR